MQRIRVFLKGNLDLYDSLHSCRINNTLCWNGINDAQEIQHKKFRVQIRHEIWTRSDALLESTGNPPQSLLDRDLALGSFTPISQFSRSLFDAKADAYILSIQPDIAMSLVRHKKEGYLFHPAHLSRWEKNDVQWFEENFVAIEPLEPAESMKNLSDIIDLIRQKSDAPILIYNTSSVIPGDQVHSYVGLTDSLGVRIQKFNLALIELSNQTGVSIVDVNRILACHGVNHLKLDTWHLNADALKLITDEVARIILELIPYSGTHD